MNVHRRSCPHGLLMLASATCGNDVKVIDDPRLNPVSSWALVDR